MLLFSKESQEQSDTISVKEKGGSDGFMSHQEGWSKSRHMKVSECWVGGAQGSQTSQWRKQKKGHCKKQTKNKLGKFIIRKMCCTHWPFHHHNAISRKYMNMKLLGCRCSAEVITSKLRPVLVLSSVVSYRTRFCIFFFFNVPFLAN